MAVSGLGVAYAASGFVLLWSGLKNTTIRDTVSSFLKGQLPAAHLTGPPTLGVGQAATAAAISPAGAAAAGDTGASSSSAAAAQAMARAMAVGMGHPTWIVGQQWQDWLSLWNAESGWSNTADTRKTGLAPPDATVFAYGIAQADPYSKMPKAGWPPDKGGSASPSTQIAWGIEYIAGRYGSPSGAWASEVANHSY